MKKSNVIIISLLAALYIIPAMVWGFNKMSSRGDYYMGFDKDIRVVRIENNSLQKEDIEINTERATFRPTNSLNFNGKRMSFSYLYYKGHRKYLPEVRMEDDVLVVGKATNAPADAKLKLHIRINNITSVVLNGETVWRR